MVTPEVLVSGGGPAGLTAAARLAGHHHRQVLVLDREEQAGGIPRHSDHTGYGLRDLGRLPGGPAYVRRLVAAAQLAGATIQPGAMVTGSYAAFNLGGQLSGVSLPAALARLAGRSRSPRRWSWSRCR